MLQLTIYFKRLILACGFVLALLYSILLALHPVQAAQALSPNTIFVVTNTNNSGVGSLRRAILDANDNPGADTIDFNLTGCPCVILLSNGLPNITGTVTIVGPGADQLAVDGDNSFRVFDVDAVPVTISDLTVQRGNTTGEGAGIRSTGALTLTDVHVLSNTAQNIGGGAYVDGPLTVTNGRFSGNQSVTSFGGGLSAYTLKITNTDFINNTGATAGGGAVVIAGTVVNGGRFERNRCTGAGCFGGGLVDFGLGSDPALILTDTVFVNNRSQDMGGGLYVNGVAALTGARFTNNHADGNGGGAYTGAATVLNDAVFERNQSDGVGGGLYVSGTVILNRTQFISNTADGGGGVHAMGAAVLNDGRFERNQASASDGGGLSTLSSLIADNTAFISNTASSDGGGVRAAGAVALNGGRFAGNWSNDKAGGLRADESLIMIDTQFISNTTLEGGGGVLVLGVARVTGGYFERNHCSASYCSGGALNAASALTLTKATFISNTSANNGGGVYAGSKLTVSEIEFVGNQASDQGGGLYANRELTVSASTFSENLAAQGGGVYLDPDGSGTIVNSLFARNFAAAGMALYLDSSYTTTVLHNTIIGFGRLGSAAIRVNAGTVGVTDTIITRHTVGISNTGGLVSEDYNLFFNNDVNTYGVVSGAHSVIGDPQFVNPANDNFHLGAGSAAINAGIDVGVPIDFDDETRPQGGGFDIGFDEYRAHLFLPLVLQ